MKMLKMAERYAARVCYLCAATVAGVTVVKGVEDFVITPHEVEGVQP